DSLKGPRLGDSLERFKTSDVHEINQADEEENTSRGKSMGLPRVTELSKTPTFIARAPLP
ncbi:hypothetical protein BX616_005386, partial [Lobosporangium transversale]